MWSHDGVDLLRTDDIEGGLWLPGIVQLLCRHAGMMLSLRLAAASMQVMALDRLPT